jgi:hypothetical protein
MRPVEFWKNFKLGEELSVSGTFLYNGIRRFQELKKLDSPDEMFEFLYSLSIGLERLFKSAIVLLEHQDDTDQKKFEESLITRPRQAVRATRSSKTETRYLACSTMRGTGPSCAPKWRESPNLSTKSSRSELENLASIRMNCDTGRRPGWCFMETQLHIQKTQSGKSFSSI